jgi:hypothetical protein
MSLQPVNFLLQDAPEPQEVIQPKKFIDYGFAFAGPEHSHLYQSPSRGIIETEAIKYEVEKPVAEAFASGKTTAEQVRVLLGFSTRMQVDEFLKRYGVYDYSVSDLERDAKTLQTLRK